MSDSLLSQVESEGDPHHLEISAITRRLDDAQRAAVLHPALTLRVLAGPGSGKTRVLTGRIHRRVLDETADPRRILALTFTRRAAGEIRARLKAGGVRDIAHVGTFHAIALQQLRQHRADQGKLGPELVSNRAAVIRSLGKPGPDLNAAITEIERAAARGTTPAAVARNRSDHIAKLAIDLYSKYEAYKRRKGLLDFDDILRDMTRLLRDDTHFAAAQRWRFRHFFVDEFQDVNRTQFDLLQAWLGDRDDLCVVGDADQAIYGWNGADARYLTGFEHWYPAATTLSLATNHRSAKPVIEAAHAVLGHRDVNIKKGSGAPAAVSSHETPEAEAKDLAARIRWAHGTIGTWASHAVLARTNAQLEPIADALAAQQIPFHVRGRGGVSRRPGAQAALEMLKSSGDRFSTALADIEFDEDPDPDASAIVELANEFATSTSAPSGQGFGQWLRTIKASDISEEHDAVDLVTFHAAKGLEWKHITIIGFEEGLVPMNESDEEQRLAYVAVTRAELSIHLSHCTTRPRGGLLERRSPSRWLTLIAAQNAPVVPAAAAQVELHIDAARTASPQRDESARRSRLRAWRERAAMARSVVPEAVLRDDHLDRIAEANPATIAGLRTATGLSEMRVRRDAAAILKALAGDVSEQRP